MKTLSGQMALFAPNSGSDPSPRIPAGADASPSSTALTPSNRPSLRTENEAGERRLRSRAFEVFTETLFPTRCAVCDAPGTPLCDRCAARLPYVDALLACPLCGAPFGRVQCTECNQVLLAPFGYERPPYDESVSACILTEKVRRIVTVYKDQGERSLARPMAAIMARYVPDRWRAATPAVAFIPATARARRRRGFDHAEHLARELSWILDMEMAPLLAMPKRLDQRKLSRMRRIDNMRSSLAILPGATVPPAVLVVDDVCTTGSTLFAAADALRKGGARKIYGVTFARA